MVTQDQSGIIFIILTKQAMPIKATVENVQNTQQNTNVCTVCNGTGKVYFIVTGSFWNKKITPTEFEQPCYKCQKK